MTKKNIFKAIDTIFWLCIAIFPLVVYCITCINANTVVTLQQFFTNLGFGINTNSLIYTSLNTIFGVGGGMLELVSDTGILIYATYFVTVMILHFVLDVLLVLIRWGHELINKATKE